MNLPHRTMSPAILLMAAACAVMESAPLRAQEQEAAKDSSTKAAAPAFASAPVPALASASAPNPAVFAASAFGARGDGRTDDTRAIQAAIDAAGKQGGVVSLAQGQFLIEGSLTIPTGVTLRGAWEAPHHGILTKNTVLLATRGHGSEEGPALIEMQQSSAIEGLTIFHPRQNPNEIVPYPWAIHGTGMHNTIENVTLVNAYNGIAIGPECNELHLIRNVFGCPLRRGIQIDGTTDIGRIENVHFNIHYWKRADAPNGPASESPAEPYRVWVQDHLEAFIFGRTDWESVKDTFTYGAYIGYKFVDMGRGAMNGSLVGIGADGCIYGMRIERIQPMGLLVTNGQFASFRHPEMPPRTCDPPVSNIVTDAGFEGNLSFVNCSTWGGNGVAWLRGGPHGVVRFSDSYFRDWHSYEKGRVAIDADGPALQVRGCAFASGGGKVVLGPKTRAAVISENLFANAKSDDVSVAKSSSEILIRDNSRP